MASTWRTGRAIAALLVLLGGFGAVGLVALSAHSMRTISVEYAADTAAIPNPERGWYDRIDSILTDRDFSESVEDGITLLHSYVRLDAFRDSPIDSATLTALDDGLDAVRAQGLKIILRVAYNDGPYPDSEPDTDETRILQHIEQLTPILQHHADVIALLEAGFIGAWGEWHTSTNGLDSDPAAKNRIIEALLAALPQSRSIALRYPLDIRAAIGTAPDQTAADGSDATRIGSHNDCFLSGDDDRGTWGRQGGSIEVDKELVGALGRYAPVGGETCAPNPARANCAVALPEMAMLHFSYLNRDYNEETLDLLRVDGCLDEISERLGYRLALSSAVLPESVPEGTSTLDIELALRNTGFASPFNARPAYLVVRGNGTVQRIELHTDVRNWEPGVDIDVSATATLAQPLTAGSYRLSLWLPDAAEELQSNPAYSIRLANQGTWDANTGENVLGTVTVRE